jgi:putative Holliday junction resolvase
VNPLLGIDLGTVRIGLAISDELHLLAHPLATISAKENVVKRIAEIVRDKKIESIIVGIPRKMSGEIGTAAADALAFVDKLRKALPTVGVITWDERLTTAAAHRALQEAGRKTHATRRYVDQVAAQMILQGYLDRQHELANQSQASREM